MLQVIPTYRVRYVAVVEPCAGAHERHEHAIEVRVPETELGSFLNVIRFNRVTKFDVQMEPLPGSNEMVIDDGFGI